MKLDECRFNKKQFVTVSLSERGVKSFTYLKNAKEGQREVYFVDNISRGGITGSIMLLGQFIFEIEAAPEDALQFTPGSTNRLYYPSDKRVFLYDDLTNEEVEAVKESFVFICANKTRIF